MKTKEVYSIKTFRDQAVSYAIFISVAFLLIGIFFTILDIISKREISWIERDIYFVALFLIGGPNLQICRRVFSGHEISFGGGRKGSGDP